MGALIIEGHLANYFWQPDRAPPFHLSLVTGTNQRPNKRKMEKRLPYRRAAGESNQSCFHQIGGEGHVKKAQKKHAHNPYYYRVLKKTPGFPVIYSVILKEYFSTVQIFFLFVKLNGFICVYTVMNANYSEVRSNKTCCSQSHMLALLFCI